METVWVSLSNKDNGSKYNIVKRRGTFGKGTGLMFMIKMSHNTEICGSFLQRVRHTLHNVKEGISPVSKTVM